MKEYRLGDTIYAKGKVKQIDEDDTALPYCVDFVNGTVWISSDNIIDELPTAEPVKPVLPKAVGEEIDNYKSHDKWFKDYIEDVFSGQDYMYAITYLANDNKLETLADAWRYGWKAEKEFLYNVKVPHVPLYYWKKPDGGIGIDDLTVATADDDTDDFEFTEAEIEHYGLQDCEKEEVTDDGMGC